MYSKFKKEFIHFCLQCLKKTIPQIPNLIQLFISQSSKELDMKYIINLLKYYIILVYYKNLVVDLEP